MADSEAQPTTESGLRLPRVTIQFCTQCKWNLRAAYFAQELLQTFSTSLGEISLQPSTGGVFKVDIFHPDPSSLSGVKIQHTSIWDRKSDGGFPETKELKRRVRDVIEPGRNLGHVDRDYSKKPAATQDPAAGEDTTEMAGKSQEKQERQQEPTAEAQESNPLPRPRDIAAKAHTLTHPPDAPQPKQREWGSHESDRKVPAGVGGTKPSLPEPKLHGETQAPKCEDCE
ncbi:hypothetical protein BR93DRAFT_404901 [Coniochaeta sp. PMI_546]|nr:hypothetical protein BR93DRAFT_404901 [Coniochaeta sp. PMI_546]